MARDNATWLEHLRNSGAEQHAALSDMRNALLRGLRRTISSKSNVDDSFLEDAVQDALILILEKLHQFEGRSQFMTWATSIAVHVAMGKLRQRRWKDVSLDELLLDPGNTVTNTSDEKSLPDYQFKQDTLLNKMYSIIQSELTEKQKSALLAELKGMPLDEIARQLAINRNAVYKLTHDARKKLKIGLETAGYSAIDVNDAFTA